MNSPLPPITAAQDYGIFSVPAYDLAQIQQDKHGRIELSCVGFWSRPVMIYLDKEHRGGWHARVDHSTGGLESGAADPLIAENNFACAIIFAIQLARMLRTTLAGMDEIAASKAA